MDRQKKKRKDEKDEAGMETLMCDRAFVGIVSDCTVLTLSSNGLEFFTDLEFLSCGNNDLTSLDVSKSTALTTLECIQNDLASLDEVL